MTYRKSQTIDDSNKYKVTAGLHCEDDTIIPRDHVCCSSQYGVIKRESTGSTGSGRRGGAFKTQLAETDRCTNIIELTLDIGGHGARDMDGPWARQHPPTQPTSSAKHGYLSAEKVKEIEYWLAEVNPEGNEGSLEACQGLPFRLQWEPSQESWPRSILHRL